jgi:hypothetical protein
MFRFLTLFLCVFAVLSLGVGPVAHAAEGPVCVETTVSGQVASADHGTSDDDGSGKNYSHQHTGCHGHHFAALTNEARAPLLFAGRNPMLAAPSSALLAALSYPALRPPQA